MPAIADDVVAHAGPRIVLPISAVIATRDRTPVLARTIESLAAGTALPREVIIVDASRDDASRRLCLAGSLGEGVTARYIRAATAGAAAQRNEGVALASQPVVWFLDDDVVLGSECLELLWGALESDRELGGVNAFITNQHYVSPGRISRTVFRLLHGRAELSYAGKCIGPALNLLPEDRPDMDPVCEVEWLNTTCTLYRREVLPSPPFPSEFTGYSLMEDVALSLVVGRRWKLANVRAARIYHDSQPGTHKQDAVELGRMEIVNRYFVMTRVLHREGLSDHLGFATLQLFQLCSALTSPAGRKDLSRLLRGKLRGLRQIVEMRSSAATEDRAASGRPGDLH